MSNSGVRCFLEVGNQKMLNAVNPKKFCAMIGEQGMTTRPLRQIKELVYKRLKGGVECNDR